MTRRPPSTDRPPRARKAAVLERFGSAGGAVERESDGIVRARSTARVVFLGAMVVVGYGALFTKASALMLLPDDRLESQASGQFEAAIEVRGRRGDVLDRHGDLLATTVDLRELHVDPGMLTPDGHRRLAEALADHLELDEDNLLERLSVERRRDVRLGRGMTPDQVAAARVLVAEDREVRRSLFVRRDRQRFYPGREDGAALLGVVGRNGIGLAGMERALDGYLQGEVHKYVQWQDRKGRGVTVDEYHADPGHDVVLTLDRRIQRVTEQALEEARISTGASAAYAVVTDVETGEILAMATVPGLNPNDGQGLDIGLLKNRAAMDAIEPGSVFKPFIAAAALDDGMITTSTLLNCESGAWKVGRKTIRDEHPIKTGTLGEVIKYSSNICAAKLALNMGPETTLRYLSEFGFGRHTGLGLPGETRGLLRDPDRIRRIELATTGYGYGASATAVQLAAGMAALGNGGVRMEPRLVREVRDRHGDLVARYDPEVDRRVVDEDHADAVVDMMIAVTRKGGTGTKAAVPGYNVAGKTGTAKKLVDGAYSATERMGSFVGLVPANEPLLAIAVVVDSPTIGPRFGGWTAGPAFSQIAGDSLRLLGVHPDPVLLAEAMDDKPDEEPVDHDLVAPGPLTPPELQWATDGRLRTPDLAGLSLRDALVTLQGAGLAVAVSGSGRVSQQTPKPGAHVGPGDQVAVVLR